MRCQSTTKQAVDRWGTILLLLLLAFGFWTGCDDGGGGGSKRPTITRAKWEKISIPCDIEVFLRLFGTPSSTIETGLSPITAYQWLDADYDAVGASGARGRVYSASIMVTENGTTFVDWKTISYNHPEYSTYISLLY